MKKAVTKRKRRIPPVCHQRGRLPLHVHFGVYDKPKFGKRDEKEAINDYRTLLNHLINPKSKQILRHIIGEETEHLGEFKEIERLECESRLQRLKQRQQKTRRK